jgi:hypothetical protein
MLYVPREGSKSAVTCNLCHKELNLLDGYFSCPDPDKAEWQFVCRACPDGVYDFSASRFFRSPESTVDWLAHLQEKRWFSPVKFFEFMDRLRANGGFYGKA